MTTKPKLIMQLDPVTRATCERILSEIIIAEDEGRDVRGMARRLYAYQHFGVPAHVYSVELSQDEEARFERWFKHR